LIEVIEEALEQQGILIDFCFDAPNDWKAQVLPIVREFIVDVCETDPYLFGVYRTAKQLDGDKEMVDHFCGLLVSFVDRVLDNRKDAAKKHRLATRDQA